MFSIYIIYVYIMGVWGAIAPQKPMTHYKNKIKWRLFLYCEPGYFFFFSQARPGYLYPRHLCRGVYSFRLSVRPFVCSFVRSFVLPSVTWNLRQSFASKFLKWCISQQLLIRKHSYLDHSYPGGLAFTP